MAYNPGIKFFVTFYELDPSAQDQCIYFTQQGRRCRWFCRDNTRAIQLHRRITESETENIFLDDIIEYVLCNCCREGRARHRDRIEDVGLLIPLAQRWLNEILTQRRQDETRKQAAQIPVNTIPKPALWRSSPAPSTSTTSATSTPSRPTVLETPITSPSYYRFGSPSPYRTCATSSQPDASPTPAPRTSLTTLTTTQVGVQLFENEQRYELRSRAGRNSVDPLSTLTSSFSQVSLSEFRPHVAEPTPSDSVSWKIREYLEDRDFEMGALYIFNRASSPGHVKIGWTARSVAGRLEDWSQCGYRPNLLFSEHGVPHAQRAETLTHHELIKEWRRERMCKAAHCRKSHQEWFEVSEEKAIQVLDDWAKFFKNAQPYDQKGSLKIEWRDVVNAMDKKGELVTSSKLLAYYKGSIKEEATPVQEAVVVEPMPKIKEQESARKEQKQAPISSEEISDCIVSIRAEVAALSKPKSLFGSGTLPPQVPPAYAPLPKAEEQPKSDLQGLVDPLQESESAVQAPSKGPFIFTAGSPSKIDPSSDNPSPSGREPLFKTQPLLKTELLPKNASLSGAILVPKTEPPSNTGASSKTRFSFANGSTSNAGLFSNTGSFSTKEPLLKTPLSFTQESLFKTQSPFKFDLSPKSEPLFKSNSLPKTQLFFNTGAGSQKPFVFGAKPLFTTEPSSNPPISTKEPLFKTLPSFAPEPLFKTTPLFTKESLFKSTPLSTKEPLFKTQSLFKTDLFSKSEPPFKASPLSKTLFDTGNFPKPKFDFTSGKSSGFQTLPKTISFLESVVKTQSVSEDQTLSRSEPQQEKVSSSKSTPVNEELSPEQIPIPPSPVLEATDCDEETSAPWGIDISEALVNLYLNEQEENSSSPTPITELQSGVTIQDEQIHEHEVKSHDDDKTTAIEYKTTSGVIEWKEEDTLVAMAAMKIVDKLSDTSSAGVAGDNEKGLGGVKVVEREVSPEIDVVSLA